MIGWLADTDTRRQLLAEDALEEAARRWQDDGAPERPGLPEPRVWARYRQANAPSELAGRYLQALNREQADMDEEAGRARRRYRLKLAAVAVPSALLLVGFLALDGWARQQGASRGFALRALAMRLGLTAPPPIPAMVDIPAGSFRMGSGDDDPDAFDDEKPRHPVSVPAFRLGRYETTFAEYDPFVEAARADDYRCPDRHRVDRPDDQRWGRDRYPVIEVSWEDASCYADWLSFLTGRTYRLPTEAEWEYAARAGTTTRFWWGDQFDTKKAVCFVCKVPNAGRNQTEWITEVNDPGFQPNPWGIYHSSGNVLEWVQDCYHESYEGVPSDGSAELSGDCALRVVRGGFWISTPQSLRSANRQQSAPSLRYIHLGFRLAKDMD